jgi:hypothetical protein
MTISHPTADVIDVPQDVTSPFALLDEVARGLAREAARAPDERAARADQILAWFAPRYAAIKAAAAAAPCPLPWTVHLADPVTDSPDPTRIPARTASPSGTSRGSDPGPRAAPAPGRDDAPIPTGARGIRLDRCRSSRRPLPFTPHEGVSPRS